MKVGEIWAVCAHADGFLHVLTLDRVLEQNATAWREGKTGWLVLELAPEYGAAMERKRAWWREAKGKPEGGERDDEAQCDAEGVHLLARVPTGEGVRDGGSRGGEGDGPARDL
jgi:hypothetical protein